MSPRPSRPSALVVVLLVLVVLVASACGAGSSGSDGGAKPLSKRAYIERLNDVQRRAAPVFADAATATKDPTTVQTHLTQMDDLIAEVAALHPPAVWKDEQADMLDALRTMRRTTEVLARASASNRTAIAGQIARYRAAQGEFQDAVNSINATR